MYNGNPRLGVATYGALFFGDDRFQYEIVGDIWEFFLLSQRELCMFWTGVQVMC